MPKISISAGGLQWIFESVYKKWEVFVQTLYFSVICRVCGSIAESGKINEMMTLLLWDRNGVLKSTSVAPVGVFHNMCELNIQTVSACWFSVMCQLPYGMCMNVSENQYNELQCYISCLMLIFVFCFVFVAGCPTPFMSLMIIQVLHKQSNGLFDKWINDTPKLSPVIPYHWDRVILYPLQ